MESKKEILPQEAARSAEKQLLDLKEADNTKKLEVKNKREEMLTFRRTVSCLIYVAVSTYKSVYPGAKGFVEGRVKSPNSIETKITNEITEKLNQIKEDPNINQEEVLRKILDIDFKDILALSVITTVPPKKFRTGSDEVNAKLSAMGESLEITNKRIEEHSSFIDTNNKREDTLSSKLYELKRRLQQAISRQDKLKLIKEQQEKLLQLYTNQELSPEEFMEEVKELSTICSMVEREDIQGMIDEKNEEIELVKENIEYGQKNADRTQEVYDTTLRNLQYQMSSYYVSNLEKFSTFKYWGTEAIRNPKLIEKTGFRAVNTGFSVTFSDLDDKDKKYAMNFEVQGKGQKDYDDAEFSWLGAAYHEEQKTKDGIISKKTEDLDFTIIGRALTDKIEKRVRRQYMDISSMGELEEYLEDNPDDCEMQNLYDELKAYEQALKNKVTDRKEIKEKMKQAFIASKEHFIQIKIDSIVDELIDNAAEAEVLLEKIQNDEELKHIFEEEKEIIKSKSNGLSESEIDHKARIRVLYRMKEMEIKRLASASVPPFFRSDITGDPKEEPVVYWFSTGESIYRYYYNKLNGLKDENGIYKYKPQEQEKRALLRLSRTF